MDCNTPRARRWVRFACSLALIANPLRLCAWYDLGHMLVAEIADGRLYAKSEARAEQLLAIKVDRPEQMARTSTFVTAACWADDVKTQRHTGAMHFINIPYSADGTVMQVEFPPKWNVVQA